MSMKDKLLNLKSEIVASKKILLFALGLIVVVCAYAITRHPNKASNSSSVPSVPIIKSNLSGDENTSYLNHIKENDGIRKENAKKNGDDYSFTFIPDKKVSNSSVADLTNIDTKVETGKDDVKLPELPSDNQVMPTIETKKDNIVKPLPVQKPKPRPRPIYISEKDLSQLNKWGEAEIASMNNVNIGIVYENDNILKDTSNNISQTENNMIGMTAGTQESIQKAENNKQAVDSSQDVKFKIPVAGTMLAAHFVSEVDNRTPGVVIGVIDSGPYAGSRLMGSFQVAQNSRKLMVQFNKMIVTWTDDDGVTQSQELNIQAVAVNPSNLSQGMATYVNRHITEKLGFQLATAYMQGLGQAIQQSGSTAMMDASGGTVVSQGSKTWTQQFLQAGGTSAAQVGNTLQSLFGNVQDTIQIAQNTPFTLLFLGNK